MPGAIGDDELAPLGGEEAIGDIDGDALLALGGEAIDQQRKIDLGALRADPAAVAFQGVELVRAYSNPASRRMSLQLEINKRLYGVFRDTPKLVPTAKQEVRDDCYGLVDAPACAVRAAPDGYNPDWTTFAVRRANEDRPGVTTPGTKPDDAKDAKGASPKDKADEDDKDAAATKSKTQKLPTDWADLGYVHPYEATVSFNQSGDVVNVTCRRLGPGTGNAVADDLVQPEPDSNPLSPKTTGSQFLPRFFTQGVAGPTEEATKKAADEKKAAAAKAKADAAKDKADAATGDAEADDDTASTDDEK